MDLLVSLVALLMPLPLVMAAQGSWAAPFAFVRATLFYLAIQTLLGLGLAAVGGLVPAAILGAYVVVGAVGGVWSWGRWRREPWLGSPPHPSPSPAVALVTGLAFVLFGAGAWLALALPVTNFDSLAYHLPSLAHWVQNGSLHTVEYLGLQRCYPMSMVALALPTSALAHGDLPLSLLGLLAFPLLAVATHRLSRQLGAHRGQAVISVALLSALPVVLRAYAGVQPDLLLAAVFVAALTEWLAFLRSGRRAPLAGWWLALCLLPGLKASGLVYSGLVLLFALGTPRGRTRRWPVVLAAARSGRGVLLAVSGLILAGAWYLRAWVACGSPLEVDAGELGASGGSWRVDELVRTTIAGALRPQEWGDWRMLGRILVEAVGLPFLLLTSVGLAGLFRRRRGGSPPEPAGQGFDSLRPALVLAFACLLAYLLTPFSADNGGHDFRLSLWSVEAVRYALPLLALLTALSAVGLSSIDRGRTPAAALVVAAMVLGLRGELSLAWIDVAACTGIGALAAIGWMRRPEMRPSSGVTLGLLLMGLGLVALLAAPHRAALRERAYGPFFAELQTIVPAGEPLAFHAIERPYPLHGADLRRPVVGWASPRRGRTLWQEDREEWRTQARQWLRSLRRSGVRHLVTRDRDPMPDWDGRGEALTRLLREDPHWRERARSGDASHLLLFVTTADR